MKSCYFMSRKCMQSKMGVALTRSGCGCYCRFTGDVKLKALQVIGGDSGQHPKELRL